MTTLLTISIGEGLGHFDHDLGLAMGHCPLDFDRAGYLPDPVPGGLVLDV